MEQRLLTYALLGNELKHVSEVANGLSCNCICANCKQKLVAKNNPKNQRLAHFAHHSGIECDGAYETVLHLLAKSILYKTKQLRLPDFHRQSFLRKGKLVTFDEVVKDGQRVNIGSKVIIPDSIGKINGKEIFIEFAKTHFVDETKSELIKKSETACVEIDLAEQLLDEDSLATFLKSSDESIYWLNNPRMEHEYKIETEKERLRKQSKEKEEQERLRQEELHKLKQRGESLGKLKNYKASKTEKILIRSEGGKVNRCPKKFEALNKLKSHGFYKHDILKRIFDGEFWNGEIYGHPPFGRHIFLSNEKISIYPSQVEIERQTEQERRHANYFFAGLKKISEAISQPEIGRCRDCKFSVEHISVDDKYYEICKHPANNETQTTDLTDSTKRT